MAVPLVRQQLSRSYEYRLQHRPRQLAREGVLLARVVTTKQGNRADLSLGAVAEARRRPGAWDDHAQCRRPREAAKRDDDAQIGQQRDLAHEVRLAVVPLL